MIKGLHSTALAVELWLVLQPVQLDELRRSSLVAKHCRPCAHLAGRDFNAGFSTIYRKRCNWIGYVPIRNLASPNMFLDTGMVVDQKETK